jgi:hypothetical protein
MADTISIVSKPRIKCFAGKIKLCNVLSNTARSYDTTLEKATKLTVEEWIRGARLIDR